MNRPELSGTSDAIRIPITLTVPDPRAAPNFGRWRFRNARHHPHFNDPDWFRSRDARRAPDVIQAAAPGDEGDPPGLAAELRMLQVDALDARGLTTQEAKIATKAVEILRSPQFEQLRTAQRTGLSTEVSISGVELIYEPSLPPDASGMTLFGNRAFVLGSRAFSSDEETVKTVLQELYRLDTSVMRGSAAADGGVARETMSAHDYAERAYRALRNF